MPNKLERHSSATASITLTASASTSPKIPFGASAGAILYVSGTSGGAATVAWYVAAGPEETALPLYANDGTAVTTAITSGRAYSLPDSLYAAPFLVGVADTGTATIRLFVKG
jgi:hypothetical protein